MALSLNYKLSGEEMQQDYLSAVNSVSCRFAEQWIKEYNDVFTGSQIVEFHDDGFTFLFDLAEDNSEPFVFGKSREPRVVAAFGMTKNNKLARDRSRMQGFIGGFESIPGYQGRDKGHFISHRIGGMLDQNLFPQKRAVNRGWSEEGKRYRKIERFCERNEGIFMFSRPIYGNVSWMPAEIEIGYLAKDLQLVVERVGN